MNSIIQLIQGNPIDYKAIIDNADISMRDDKAYICAIIGLRGRKRFIEPTINSILNGGGMVAVTVVECDTTLHHKKQCVDLGVSYIGIKTKRGERYNRSLAFNVGAILSNHCEWFLTHDIDCMVKDNFFGSLLRNAHGRSLEALQSFNKRRVLYCSTQLSKSLIDHEITVNNLNEDSDGISTYSGNAPGGSIFITRDLFFDIGGYDPELFYGYAPEDRFFWDKMSTRTVVGSADNPVTDIFHLHHKSMMGTNPELNRMIRIADSFCGLTQLQKQNIVKYKQEILSPWY